MTWWLWVITLFFGVPILASIVLLGPSGALLVLAYIWVSMLLEVSRVGPRWLQAPFEWAEALLSKRL